MLTIIPSIMLGFFNRRFDSRYPKIGEKIILKNLSTLDEGERHIAIVSMYKNYGVNLALLMSQLYFSIFSIDTGSNQT